MQCALDTEVAVRVACSSDGVECCVFARGSCPGREAAGIIAVASLGTHVRSLPGQGTAGLREPPGQA